MIRDVIAVVVICLLVAIGCAWTPVDQPAYQDLQAQKETWEHAAHVLADQTVVWQSYCEQLLEELWSYKHPSYLNRGELRMIEI